MKTTLCVLATVSFLCGCADLTVYRIQSDNTAPLRDQNKPLVGDVSYYLPRTAITMTGTVTLDSCEPSYPPQLKVTATLTPVVSTEPDRDYHYRISYEESRTWMKEINFAIVNQGGVFQTFNGTINDQVGPDAVAAIGAIIQIGGAVATAGVGTPALLAASDVRTIRQQSPHDVGKDFCLNVRKALNKIAGDNIVIKDAKIKISQGADVKAQTLRLQNAQSDVADQIKAAKLTRSISFKWIPSSSDLDHATIIGDYYLVSTPISLTPVINDWLTDEGKTWLASPPPENSKTDERLQLKAPFLITLAVDGHTISSTFNAKDPLVSSQTGTLDKPGGLLIRDPALATLRICRQIDPDCTAQGDAPAPGNLVETTNDVGPRVALALPQFGRLMILPEHSALFENATLTATLNADGTISTIGYHSVSTAAAGLTALATNGGAATTAIAARNTAIAGVNTAAAAVTTAKTTQIQGELSL